MQRAAAEQLAFGQHNREIANMLGEFQLGARQHNAFGGISVDQIENRRDIVHPRLAHLKRGFRTGLLGKMFRGNATDHAFCTSAAISRVPTGSSRNALASTPACAPGAIRTCRTPCSSALVAAFNFACMPPVATPAAMRSAHS